MEGFSHHRVLLVLIIASLGIALGALWEITEWLADFLTPKQIVSGLTDTITDMMLDSGGALLAALLNLWGLHERSRAGEQTSQTEPTLATVSLRKRP
jgi:hypothetical protein